MLANRPAQHRIPCLQRIQHRPLRGLPLDLEFNLSPNFGQRSQMMWKQHSDRLHVLPLSPQSVICILVIPLRAPNLFVGSFRHVSRLRTIAAPDSPPAAVVCHHHPRPKGHPQLRNLRPRFLQRRAARLVCHSRISSPILPDDGRGRNIPGCRIADVPDSHRHPETLPDDARSAAACCRIEPPHPQRDCRSSPTTMCQTAASGRFNRSTPRSLVFRWRSAESLPPSATITIPQSSRSYLKKNAASDRSQGRS